MKKGAQGYAFGRNKPEIKIWTDLCQNFAFSILRPLLKLVEPRRMMLVAHFLSVKGQRQEKQEGPAEPPVSWNIAEVDTQWGVEVGGIYLLKKGSTI